jgi:hypothetical protein
LTAGERCTFTLLVDNIGLGENWTIGTEEMKNPRGILDYGLFGQEVNRQPRRRRPEKTTGIWYAGHSTREDCTQSAKAGINLILPTKTGNLQVP